MMIMLHEIPHPVICSVLWIATAAGCQLAACCDLILAADNVRFSTPGVKIGLIDNIVTIETENFQLP